MSTKTVKPENFEKVVLDLLTKYGDETYEISQECAKAAARKTCTEIKGSAPSGGPYARGWSHKALKNGHSEYTEIVYNRTDYQLTHLLESPHATGRYKGGHYPTHVDYTGTLARINDKQVNEFINDLRGKL